MAPAAQAEPLTSKPTHPAPLESAATVPPVSSNFRYARNSVVNALASPELPLSPPAFTADTT